MGPVTRAGAPKHGGYVLRDRVAADIQAITDLAVGEAIRYQVQYLGLTCGKVARRCVRWFGAWCIP